MKKEIINFLFTKVIIISIFISTILVIGCVFYLTSIKSENENSQKILKNNVEAVSKITNQETIEIKKRLSNDQLSELTSEEILEKYNDSGKEKLNSIFQDNKSSKDYALTLIGKVIPTTTLISSDGDTINLNNKSIVVIMNTGEKSKSFTSTLLKSQFPNSVKPVILFPADSNNKIDEFVKETELGTKNFKIVRLDDNPKNKAQSDLLGIAEYYFNAKGAPAYVSIDTNSITLAGSGNDENSWNRFLKSSFEEPYLFNEIKE